LSLLTLGEGGGGLVHQLSAYPLPVALSEQSPEGPEDSWNRAPDSWCIHPPMLLWSLKCKTIVPTALQGSIFRTAEIVKTENVVMKSVDISA